MIWNSGFSSKASGHEERNRVSSYRGYLFKLRRSKNVLAPQWGKRWITLEGHFLKWYRQETDLSPSGMVDLKFVRSIRKVDSGPQWAFSIICEERTLVLRCTTKNEMNNWIRALHIQADIARGGTGMTVVSNFNQVSVEVSPPRYGGPKNRKPATSLSLEQELENTLAKLRELEVQEKKSEDFTEEDITDLLPRYPPSNQSSGRIVSNIGEASFVLPSGVRGESIPGRGRDDSGSISAHAGPAVSASANISYSSAPSSSAAAATTTISATAATAMATTKPPARGARQLSPKSLRLPSDDLEDSTGSAVEVPVRIPRSQQRALESLQASTPQRNLSRSLSNNSIENISLDTKAVSRAKARGPNGKRAGGRGGRGGGGGDDYSDGDSYYPRPQVTLSPEEDVLSDEFDFDASPGFRPTPVKDKRLEFELATESLEESPVQMNVVRVMGRHQPPPEIRVKENKSPMRQATGKTNKSLRSAWDTA